MRCMEDNNECDTVWTRGCFHSVCDRCYTGECPLSMCVGGDSARMEHEERLCRRIIEEGVSAPTVRKRTQTLYEWLARLTNPVAVDKDAAYCVHGGQVKRVELMSEPAPVVCERVLLAGSDFAGSVLIDTRGEIERTRYRVWPREARIEPTDGASAETHEPIPWPDSPMTPWYVYELDLRTVIPVIHTVRTEEPDSDPEHVRMNGKQLRKSIDSRLKQIEWMRDARTQMNLTRERVARLPADHPFREQFARWQATPVEFAMHPHELTAYERRMVEGDGIYIGNGRHTRDASKSVYNSLPPVRLIDGRLTLHGRTLAQFAEPVALAWDSRTKAVLITAPGRALLKFYCVYQMVI